MPTLHEDAAARMKQIAVQPQQAAGVETALKLAEGAGLQPADVLALAAKYGPAVWQILPDVLTLIRPAK